MRHPNPLVPVHAMPGRVEALAAEIGEKDRSILFFDWLSYTDREALLAEADIGAMLHPVHVETRFSIRTRVLDYLWAAPAHPHHRRRCDQRVGAAARRGASHPAFR